MLTEHKSYNFNDAQLSIPMVVCTQLYVVGTAGSV